MKIGIVGSGIVARTLGPGLARHGHEVALGTRDPARLAEFAAANPSIPIVSPIEAAEFGDMVVLAVKGSAALQAASTIAGGLSGKPVLDTSNPFTDVPPVDGVLSCFTESNEALMEQLQRAVPRARFVKAFNSVGALRMIDPPFKDGPPTMFIAGNDAEAKSVVTGLLAQVGWDVADMGPAAAARAVEALGRLWCIPGFREGSWTHAFRLLR